MAFPAYAPSQRAFVPGTWPVKAFNAQDGAEVRILYGTRRTQMKLSLSYSSMTDDQAAEFLQHYIEVKGTFQTFSIPAETKAGWESDPALIDATASGNAWRYAEPPSVESVYPGISNVSLSLIGVF